MNKNHILVIKHGALGDLVQLTGIFKSIRDFHSDSAITLLTDKKFQTFTKQMPYFNNIWSDYRPRFWNLRGWLQIVKLLRSGKFCRVYDLQSSDRTSVYYFLMSLNRNLEWSGNRLKGNLRYKDPNFSNIPVVTRVIRQVSLAGINKIYDLDISWLHEKSFNLDEVKKPYVILVPGSSAHLKHKRWPAENYGAIAQKLYKKGINSVVIGTEVDKSAISQIKNICKEVIDLSGGSLGLVATLARGAIGAIANDTGPTYILAAAGCPITWILSHHTDPKIVLPMGAKVLPIKKENINDIAVEKVEQDMITK